MSRKRALDKLAARLERKVKLNLGSVRKIRYNDGKTKRKRLDSTGRARKSVKVKSTSKGIELYSEKYLDFLDKGVSGTKFSAPKSPYRRRKAPSPDQMRRITRRMKPRDKDGKFIEDTPQARRAMEYAIGQAIKEKGTPRTNILSDAVDEVLKDIDETISDIADDLINDLDL